MVSSCQFLFHFAARYDCPDYFSYFYLYTFSVSRYKTEFSMMKQNKTQQNNFINFFVVGIFWHPVFGLRTRVNFSVYSQDVNALTQFKLLMDAVNGEAP